MNRSQDEPRPVEEPRSSVALAVLGTMLEDAEARHRFDSSEYAEARLLVLREARDRVAQAEAAL